MLIVLDTNVLVSALLKRNSFPGKILDLVLDGVLQLALDEHIFNEYVVVLSRPRFQFPQDQVNGLLSFLRISGFWIEKPLPKLFEHPVIDPGDLPFGEVAVHSNASVLITGNKKHYAFLQKFPVKVLLPQEFLNVFGQDL